MIRLTGLATYVSCVHARGAKTDNSTGRHLEYDAVAVRLIISLGEAMNPKIRLTNDFHTPKAVPRRALFPTRIGIDAINVIALVLSAKELNSIGASGWTVVKPIRANTMI